MWTSSHSLPSAALSSVPAVTVLHELTGQFTQLSTWPIDSSMHLAKKLYSKFWAYGGIFGYSAYVILKNNTPFCPELPALCSSLVHLDCYLAALYYFFHNPLTLMFAILKAFSYRPYFLNLLLFLWPSGTLACFGSVLWKDDLIQSEIIPAWPYRTCVSTLISCLLNPAVSFPTVTEVLCAAMVCTHMRKELLQWLQSQMRNGVSGLVRMLPPKAKMPLSAIHPFLYKQALNLYLHIYPLK